jgi:Aldo/keto reductase family
MVNRVESAVAPTANVVASRLKRRKAARCVAAMVEGAAIASRCDVGCFPVNGQASRSEKLIGRAVAGQRDRVFLVSKVEANEVSGDGIARACQVSLSRLGTNFLDLYLLHWPVPNSQFSDVVAGFEQLRAAGKIPAWGVSNFSTS